MPDPQLPRKANEPNPYASPPADVFVEPLLPDSMWHEVQAQVVSVRRGWTSRTVVISGNIDAEIRYQGEGGGERVYVDGVIRGRSSPLQMSWKVVAPRIEFTVPWRGYQVPASIDVAASWLRLGRLYDFRLTIAGQLVYDEFGQSMK